MKKRLISLLLTLATTTAVHAQVPLSGSTITATTSVTTPYVFSTGLPASISGTSGGYTGWGKNGTGDFDFFAANNGSSPSFYWYFLLGSTQTAEMFLDTGGNLHVPNGNVTANSLSAAASVALPHYTAATIPSAVTLGAGATVVVSDCNVMALASTICAGGGTNYMLAISNGANWTMH
jgi:hypothetical protein